MGQSSLAGMVAPVLAVALLLSLQLCAAQKHGELRLVGPQSALGRGRLEVFDRSGVGRAWSTVCSVGFGEAEATVACKQLGHVSPGRAAHQEHSLEWLQPGTSDQNMLAFSFKCSGGGSERTLFECMLEHNPECDSHSPSLDVGLDCSAAAGRNAAAPASSPLQGSADGSVADA